MVADNIGGNFNPPTDFLEGLSISQEADPGQLTVQWRISSFTTDELIANQDSGFFANPFATSDPGVIRARAPNQYDVELTFRPGRFGKLQGEVRDVIEGLASEAGLRAQLLLSQAPGLNDSFDVDAGTENVQVPLGGETEGERTFSIPTIRVPVPEGESLPDIPIDAWPTLQIDISASVPGAPGSLPVFGPGQKTIRQKIPPAAFIDEVELSGDCSVLYQETDSRIDRLRSDVNAQVSGAESAIDNLQEFANEIATEANISTGTSPEALGSRIEDLSTDELRDIGTSRLQSIKTEVEGISTRDNLVTEMRDRFDELQSDINSQVGSDCLPGFMDRLEEIDPNIRELASLASTAVSLKEGLMSALSNVESIDCGTVYSSLDRRLEDLEDTVGVGSASPTISTPVTVDRFQELRSNVNDIRDSIQNQVPSDDPCNTELLSRADNIVGQLQDLSRQEADPLGCGDISGNLRSRAESIQGSIGQWTRQDQIVRRPERKEELLSETSDIISDLEDKVDDNNPCKGRLISRVRNARALIQRTPARPESAIPCEQRFPDLGERIDQFEDQVLSLSAPVRPEEVQTIANEGQQIIDQVDSQIDRDSDCRQEMPERIRSLVQRVERLTTQVRIQTQVQDESEQRRQELIEQLLGSIDTIQQTRESVDDISEDVDIPVS